MLLVCVAPKLSETERGGQGEKSCRARNLEIANELTKGHISYLFLALVSLREGHGN